MKNEFKFVKLSQVDPLGQVFHAKNIYNFLFSLNFEYPQFNKWYWSLFDDSGVVKSNRELLICLDDGIVAGVSILKKDDVECKICTLRVSKQYQNLGVGSKLLEKSFEILENEKPLITIHISKFHEFEKIFNRYNFKLEQEISGCYGFFRSELSYNGVLETNLLKEEDLFNKISLKLEKLMYCYPDEKKIYIPKKRILNAKEMLFV